jgi:colanic acid biosynthesis glycosyl transferase WcaI
MKEVDRFRSIYQLDGKFVVTYAGIMSFSQDLETIILAAKKVRDLHDVVFLMVGDGPKKSELISLAGRLKLSNVVFLPFQVGKNYWRLLLASDVCLVSLKSSVVKTPVVPRKMIDIMMTGRTIIANVPLDGDVPYFIAQADCGIAVEPENPDELAKSIVEMYSMPLEERERLGKNGKDYSHKNFSLEKFAEAYESIFYSIARIKR